MDKEQIIKALEKHGVKVADQYFKPSATERKAFMDLLQVVEKQTKINDQLNEALKNKSSHVPLVNLNPPSLKKIPEL